MDDKVRPIDAGELIGYLHEKTFVDGDDRSMVYKAIEEQPTVEVEPVKRGRWIIDYAEGSKIYHAHCSECGKEPTRNIGGDYYIDKLSDFCPNCGARMSEV